MVDSFQPMDCSLPDSSVHGISQARILEWVAISFFRGSSWPWDGTRIFCIGRQILYHRATWEAQTFVRVPFPLLLMNILECGCFCMISDFPTKGQKTHSWHHGVLHSAGAIPGTVIHSLNKHSLSIWWVSTEAVCAQSCLTLCDPMDCSLSGSFVLGIFQARVLEWGAIAFSE